jgi:hypothetical protein
LVSPQRMVVRDFDDDDQNSIRIRDPHLHQPPRLAPRFAENRYTGVQQSPMLGVYISDLDPQRDRVSRRIRRPTADLEKTVAQEEHQAGCVRAAELPVDGQTQRVPVEPVAATGLRGAQKSSAAEDVHVAHPPFAAAAPTATYELLVTASGTVAGPQEAALHQVTTNGRLVHRQRHRRASERTAARADGRLAASANGASLQMSALRWLDEMSWPPPCGVARRGVIGER